MGYSGNHFSATVAHITSRHRIRLPMGLNCGQICVALHCESNYLSCLHHQVQKWLLMNFEGFFYNSEGADSNGKLVWWCLFFRYHQNFFSYLTFCVCVYPIAQCIVRRVALYNHIAYILAKRLVLSPQIAAFFKIFTPKLKRKHQNTQISRTWFTFSCTVQCKYCWLCQTHVHFAQPGPRSADA